MAENQNGFVLVFCLFCQRQCRGTGRDKKNRFLESPLRQLAAATGRDTPDTSCRNLWRKAIGHDAIITDTDSIPDTEASGAIGVYNNIL